MAKHYRLHKGEKIIFKSSKVRHGYWGAYSHILIITNESVILEKYGLFDFFKGIERYNYTDLNQAIQGEARNGEKQLEMYISDKVEEFALQSDDEIELKVLIMAINDQMGPDAEYYDLKYYQDLLKGAREDKKLLELRARAQEEEKEVGKSTLEFVGNTAKNIIKSGDISIKGITKGISKAAKKQKRKGILGEFKDVFLEDLGIRDIQDEFIEMGNEFREEFGLKPKITYEERKKLAELEEKEKQKKLKKQTMSAMDKRIKEQKELIKGKKKKAFEEEELVYNQSLKNVNDQLDALKKAKELFDMGILTEEEFEQKKKEIMNK